MGPDTSPAQLGPDTPPALLSPDTPPALLSPDKRPALLAPDTPPALLAPDTPATTVAQQQLGPSVHNAFCQNDSRNGKRKQTQAKDNVVQRSPAVFIISDGAEAGGGGEG
eukprot:225381-Chlamydomonas_euryale.AAC.1